MRRGGKRTERTGQSPQQAVKAAARRCAGINVAALPAGKQVAAIEGCIHNEIAIDNAPARGRVTDAMVKRVAKAIGARRGLSGLRRKRRRR